MAFKKSNTLQGALAAIDGRPGSEDHASQMQSVSQMLGLMVGSKFKPQGQAFEPIHLGDAPNDDQCLQQ